MKLNYRYTSSFCWQRWWLSWWIVPEQKWLRLQPRKVISSFSRVLGPLNAGVIIWHKSNSPPPPPKKKKKLHKAMCGNFLDTWVTSKGEHQVFHRYEVIVGLLRNCQKQKAFSFMFESFHLIMFSFPQLSINLFSFRVHFAFTHS